MGQPRVPVLVTVVLGVVPIAAFGSWFYGYGVLVEPIRMDTGWSEVTLSSAYGLGLLAGGIGATVAGRLLDRRGSRMLFLLAAAASALGHAATSTATTPAVFAVAAVATGGVVGAVGYYSAVHAVLARLAPGGRARVITVNTLWGAFASPIFLPLVGWLAVTVDWRWTLRIAGGLVTLSFAAAGLLVPDVRGHADDQQPSLRRALAASAGHPAVRSLLLAGLGGGIASSLLFLYQVPAMVDAGLALGLATALAGARGLLQLGGRIPLPWIVRRVGARRALRASFLLTGTSCLLLLAAGSLPVAVTFAVVAGVAVGALAALESIYAAEVVDARAIGIALGMYSLLRGIGAAVGPVAGGALATSLDSRVPALALAAVAGSLAALLVPATPSPDRPAAPDASPDRPARRR